MPVSASASQSGRSRRVLLLSVLKVIGPPCRWKSQKTPAKREDVRLLASLRHERGQSLMRAALAVVIACSGAKAA